MRMNANLPSAAELRAALQRMRISDMERVAQAAGVPFATLMKIRTGTTSNPGLETVRKFIGHIDVSGDEAQGATAGANHG
jgi:transcriptional regulator with XRE-family HTH domain